MWNAYKRLSKLINGPDLYCNYSILDELIEFPNEILYIFDDLDILFTEIKTSNNSLPFAINKLVSFLDANENVCFILIFLITKAHIICIVRDLTLIPLNLRRAGRLERCISLPLLTSTQRALIFRELISESSTETINNLTQITPYYSQFVLSIWSSGFSTGEVCKFVKEIRFNKNWDLAAQRIKESKLTDFDVFVPSVTWDQIIGF